MKLKNIVFIRLIQLLNLVWGLSATSLASAELVPEYDMKAAFIYNFAIFTEWPETSNYMKLCAIGNPLMEAALENMENKEIHGATIKVIKSISSTNVNQCQVLYIGDISASSLIGLQKSLSDAPVLTITDTNSNMQFDSIIQLKLVNKHLVFEVNLEAAKRVKLNLSSKVLTLANKVR